MKISKEQKKERLVGVLVGTVLPVVTLLIANYVLLQYYPITIDEFGLNKEQRCLLAKSAQIPLKTIQNW